MGTQRLWVTKVTGMSIPSIHPRIADICVCRRIGIRIGISLEYSHAPSIVQTIGQ